MIICTISRYYVPTLRSENFAIGGTGIFSYGNIKSNNLSYTIGLSRNNTHNNPIFPVVDPILALLPN